MNTDCEVITIRDDEAVVINGAEWKALVVRVSGLSMAVLVVMCSSALR